MKILPFKKLIRKLHLWLGLGSGIVVFIVSLTGCIYAFERELKKLFYHDRIFVSSENNQRLSLEQLIDSAKQALNNQYEPLRWSIPQAKDQSIRLQFWEFYPTQEKTFGSTYADVFKYYYSVYVNPYTGEVVNVEDSKWEFFNVVYWLHRSLLLGDFGKQIVGYSTLIFVFILISGIILWWPRNKKALKMGTWFRWKPSSKWRRKNYDLHKVFGFYSFLLALTIAITGLVYSFGWVKNGISWIINGGPVVRHWSPPTSGKQEKVLNHPINKVYNDVRTKFPSAEEYLIIPPRDSMQAYLIYVRSETNYDNKTFWYDQYTGERLAARHFSDKNATEKLMAIDMDIHTGKVLGLPTKILAFFASLISASLPVTGTIIWWNRRKKKKGSGKKKIKVGNGKTHKSLKNIRQL